jgi:hypothetical protein
MVMIWVMQAMDKNLEENVSKVFGSVTGMVLVLVWILG